MATSLPAYETIGLVMQGGGALGAYQAGVFEGLTEAGIMPNWLSGISVGALNIAIIAGNAPKNQVSRLKEFWETICQPRGDFLMNPFSLLPQWQQNLFPLSDLSRSAISTWHASSALIHGQKGFFRPRFPPVFPYAQGTPETASYYDTSDLKGTLERLCDFDRINSTETRVTVGAVNVRNGNFAYFDNRQTRLRAEHFMASGALPPAFPAVEIDGEHYWDGGLVSNTPLAYLLESRPMQDTLVFQVDLWSARGNAPTNLNEVSDRVKEIQYSSRTRMVTDQLQKRQQLRQLVRKLLNDLPEDVRSQSEYAKLAQRVAGDKRYNVIHLIYRDKAYEHHYKDYEFGTATMHEHWDSGLQDIRQTLLNPDYLAMPDDEAGFVTHDVHRDEIEQGLKRPL